MPALLYEWDKTFDSPLQKAQAEVLFLLAGGLRRLWPDLYETTRDFRGTWVGYVEGIAEDFCNEVHRVSSRSAAADIWARFELTGLVKQSPPKVRSIFDQVHRQIEDHLKESREPLLYLVECNSRACAAIRDLLQGLEVEGLDTSEARLLMVYDEHGGSPLSSTYLGKGPIHWAVQPKPRAFWAALAAQSVLEHEYLSHLVPRSQSLSPSVREEWLMEVLLLDTKRRSNADHSLLWYLLYSLREVRELKHSNLPNVAYAMVSTEPYRTVYRRFNRELLTLPTDPHVAKRVDQILKALDAMPPEGAGQLFARWNGSIAGFPGEGRDDPRRGKRQPFP